MWKRLVPAGTLLVAIACSPTSGDLARTTPSSTELAGATIKYDPDAGTDYAACNTAPADDRRAQVCWHWTCDNRAATPATWNGDAATCRAGTLDPAAGARTLALVNLQRFLADLPAVDVEPAWSPAAQECALVAHANAKLSHEPPSDWKCWSETAFDASKVSLVANRSAPPSVGAFMQDPGNDTTIVHRRWLLSDQLTRIGIGSTDHYACLVVDGASLDRELDAGTHDVPPATGRTWAAWPPAGPVPIDVFTSDQLDTIGWTIQSGVDDLDPKTAVIAVNGVAQPIAATLLEAQLGSRSAVKIVPDGWKTAAGTHYDVTVSGASTHIVFSIDPVDCTL